MGRPSSYTPEMADKICELITTGYTCRQIEAMKDMPSWPAICRWLREHEDFRKQYAQAREFSAEPLEAEALFAVRTAKTAEEAAIARGILDAVKWTTAKRNPKVFGDKIEVGGDLAVHHGIDRPPIETRDTWLARRRNEINGVALALGTTAGSAD